jgi:putative peptidoglycan lipid II flippase
MADITRGVRAFTFGTAVSRVLGLARESVFAFLYGAGRSTDAFNAAFRILDLLRDLFAESTLSASIVPILTSQRQKGKSEQNRLASNVFNALLLCVGLITLLGIIFAPVLSQVIAFGFKSIPGKTELTSRLTALIFPFLLFIALAAWAMSYLNTENEFLIPSLAPAAFNLFSIITAVVLYAYLIRRGTDPIFGMAIGVLVGGLLQFVIQIPSLLKNGFRYVGYLNFKDPEFRKIIMLFLPIAIGLAGSRINVAADVIMVSFLAERSMTWLHYAFRIMHLPLGLFGIAVGTVALPTLSRYVADKNLTDFRKTLFDSLKLVFFLTVSSTVLIIFLSHPITKIIYERGKFNGFDTSMTVQALIMYLLGVPFASGLRNLASAYYAFRDSKTPMYASLLSICANIILNYILMHLMGFKGIALATSIAALINCSILIYRLPQKIGSFDLTLLLKYFMMLVICSCFGGLCGFIVNKVGLSLIPAPHSFITQIAVLILSGGLSLVMFCIACVVLGVSEVKDYVKKLTRR